MVFGGRPLSDLSLDDFISLIDNRILEGQHLEYKREEYDVNHRHEMLRDITALANAEGGYLILGIEEDSEHLPVSITAINNPHSIAERMLQRCLDCIDERIEGLEIQAYDTGFNQGIIVVRVPYSTRRPHIAILENQVHISRRYGTHKRPMTIGEIRHIILSSGQSHQPLNLSSVPNTITSSSPTHNEPQAAAAIANVLAKDVAALTVDDGDLPAVQQLAAQLSHSASGSAGQTRIGLSHDVPNEDVGGSSAVQLITDRPVERFVYRYLSHEIVAQALLIVSPFIGNVSGTGYNLKGIIKKATADRTRIIVITQAPQEKYQEDAMLLLSESPYTEIRYDPDLHAKLYVCWTRDQSQSFAMLGSGNLTQHGIQQNVELGLMIFPRGEGRVLLQELYQWASVNLRTRPASKLVKRIKPTQ